MLTRKTGLLPAAAASLLLLAGCGGGGGGSSSPSQPLTPLPPLSAAPCAAGDLAYIVSPTLAHTTTAGRQDGGRLCAQPGGGFVMVYVSDDQDGDEYGVYMRLFDASGAPTTGEVLVTQDTVDDQDNPSVAVFSDGSFAVSWTSGPFSWESKPSPDGDGTATIARLFEADGTPKGNEFRVNDSTTHDQRNSTMLALTDDTLVCVYRVGRGITTSPGAFGEEGFVAFKRYSKDGVQLQGETVVVDSREIGAIRLIAEPDDPHAVALENGRFAIAWVFTDLHRPDAERIGPPYPSVIQACIFNGDGSRHTNTVVVSQHPTDRDTLEIYPRVAAAPGGGFAVAWQSLRDSSAAVRVRHYDLNSIPRGGEQAVVPLASTDSRRIEAHEIAPIPGHGFAVSAYFGTDGDVVTQFIDAAGAPSGSTLTQDLVDSPLFRFRGLSHCLLPNGNWVFAYRVDGADLAASSDVAYAVLGCP